MLVLIALVPELCKRFTIDLILTAAVVTENGRQYSLK